MTSPTDSWEAAGKLALRFYKTRATSASEHGHPRLAYVGMQIKKYK